MPKLPVLSGKELLQILQRRGFIIVRQKGSHVTVQKDMHRSVIPLHDELAKGTLHAILQQCGLTSDDLR